MRGSFAEDTFKNSPYIILCDGVLKVFVGKGCVRTKDGVGNGLGKCSRHNDVSLTGFVMEDLSHRREQEAKKGF